jgi:predicted amidohydrolase
MRLALAQLDATAGDVDANLDRAERAVADAAARGADLVVLPELFTVGYFAFDSYARAAEGLDGPTFGRLADVAADHGIGLLAGSHVEDLAESAAAGADVPAAEGLANTCVFYDRGGGRRGVYRKHHLFGYQSAETRLLTPGDTLSTVDFEGFTVGMSTCYDLRFPELYRRLADRGATLVCVPSAWPYPRVEHWRTLARARARSRTSPTSRPRTAPRNSRRPPSSGARPSTILGERSSRVRATRQRSSSPTSIPTGSRPSARSFRRFGIAGTDRTTGSRGRRPSRRRDGQATTTR